MLNFPGHARGWSSLLSRVRGRGSFNRRRGATTGGMDPPSCSKPSHRSALATTASRARPYFGRFPTSASCSTRETSRMRGTPSSSLSTTPRGTRCPVRVGLRFASTTARPVMDIEEIWHDGHKLDECALITSGSPNLEFVFTARDNEGHLFSYSLVDRWGSGRSGAHHVGSLHRRPRYVDDVVRCHEHDRALYAVEHRLLAFVPPFGLGEHDERLQPDPPHGRPRARRHLPRWTDLLTVTIRGKGRPEI